MAGLGRSAHRADCQGNGGIYDECALWGIYQRTAQRNPVGCFFSGRGVCLFGIHSALYALHLSVCNHQA